MQTEVLWQRAILLAQQRRWEQALRELQGLLALAPDHASAHALTAQVLTQLDRDDEALTAAQKAVGLQPDFDFAHGVLAGVLYARRELPAAKAAVLRAIALDPDDVRHRTVLAQILLGQHDWNAALAAADEGLRLAPEDTDLLNLRSIALTRLGRGKEATDSVDASLAHDPDNPYTHQARGVALLHRGDAKGALHHFQEALRRDPQLEGSREGLVEALKAHNPVYRVVLLWFLWMNRFSPARQVQIVIGLWLLARFGGDGLERAGWPNAATAVRYSWLGFVLLTACAVPLFNLLLLVHPIGRHALERRARNDAIVLGACVLVGIGVGAHALFGDAPWSGAGWIFWLVFLLPVAGIGSFHPGWTRWLLQAFCVVCVASWCWWAIRLQMLTAEALATVPEGTSREGLSRYEHVLAPLGEHAALLRTLVTAVVLSTWYVLLAPKGQPKRRRGA